MLLKSLSFSFLIIVFFACAKKNDNGSLSSKNESTDLTLDSSIFKISCFPEDSFNYSGSFSYEVKDLKEAVSRLWGMEKKYRLYLTSRNENASEYQIQHDFQYSLETSDFLSLEQTLDSMFGPAMQKSVSIYQNKYKENLTSLEDKLDALKVHYNAYQNSSDSAEKLVLEGKVREEESNIKYLIKNLRADCENRSNVRINFIKKIKTSALFRVR